MVSLVARFAQRLGFVSQAEASRRAVQAAGNVGRAAALHQRNLSAALTTNDVASWQPDALPINDLLGSGLATILNRSRDAARSNPLARRFLGLLRRNVLGPKGLRLQVRLRTEAGLKNGVNDAIESAHEAWCRAGACDVTGRHTRKDLDRLALRHLAVDGAVFCRFISGRGPHGLQLELLKVDALALTHRADLADGGRIRLGIEIDAFGALRAFWLKAAHGPALEAHGTSRPMVRVPASEMLLLTIVEEADQLLGLPWMQAALKPMYQANDFASAGLNKARESAKRGGFIEQDPDAPPPPPLNDGTDTAADGTQTPYQTVQDGTWDVLPAGLKATPFESDYPNIEYGQFIKDCLRNVASALEVSYISLGNDLSDVNYSSGQLGLGDERTLWQELQEWFIDHWTRPIDERWLQHALLAAPELQSLSFARLDTYLSAFNWQRHVWQPLDPLKTIEAQTARLEAGITSPQRVMAENGDDPDEVLDEIKEWADKLAARGLPEPQPQDAAAKARRFQLIAGGASATGTE
jgi:lambda family phage portal protein